MQSFFLWWNKMKQVLCSKTWSWKISNLAKQLWRSRLLIVRKICSVVESGLEDLRRSPIYENLIPILDIETWPDDADILFTYGESCIDEIVEPLEPLLISYQCNVKHIPNQWSSLKQRVIEIKKVVLLNWIISICGKNYLKAKV